MYRDTQDVNGEQSGPLTAGELLKARVDVFVERHPESANVARVSIGVTIVAAIFWGVVLLGYAAGPFEETPWDDYVGVWPCFGDGILALLIGILAVGGSISVVVTVLAGLHQIGCWFIPEKKDQY